MNDPSPKLDYGIWDAKYNRPIVDGKVTNPHTGEIEDAGPMLVAGLPSIQASWFNISSTGTWRSVHAPIHCPIDDLLCAVISHVKDGLYTIESLNASTYSLTVVCSSSQSTADFHHTISTMRATFDQSRPDDTVYPLPN
ncbi:hypothetical protein ONS95_014944 [Cadophora gregata]|uniref:uncharacterized protein n=1 Tax=Cadophora gregata TaxID=51156 RepID=UPI0026DD5D62|nr:uncharacterized protein ONS95_014944 [Cadophora gregata]KAK0103144.1 hypothetical protein ONS96_005753 [Cadophora gregata f. sp. sojae]KAK0113248.1 hypothetical protein ONS95_014944 [Cadophora gregata]